MFQAADRLARASRLTGDKSLGLLAAGFLLYAVALSLEMIGAFYSSSFAMSHPAGRRPVEVTAIIVNRGTLLALPLYGVAYTLIAASFYVGHIPSGGRLYSVLPLIVLVYADINVVNLILLTASIYYSLSRYGRAHTGNLLFFGLAWLSHFTAALILLAPEWWLTLLSIVLRPVAAIAFYVVSRK